MWLICSVASRALHPSRDWRWEAAVECFFIHREKEELRVCVWEQQEEALVVPPEKEYR